MTDFHDLEELDREECLRLLRSHVMGRLAVALPARAPVVPVNYAVDGETIVFRSDPGDKLRTLRQSVARLRSRSHRSFAADRLERPRPGPGRVHGTTRRHRPRAQVVGGGSKGALGAVLVPDMITGRRLQVAEMALSSRSRLPLRPGSEAGQKLSEVGEHHVGAAFGPRRRRSHPGRRRRPVRIARPGPPVHPQWLLEHDRAVRRHVQRFGGGEKCVGCGLPGELARRCFDSRHLDVEESSSPAAWTISLSPAGRDYGGPLAGLMTRSHEFNGVVEHLDAAFGAAVRGSTAACGPRDRPPCAHQADPRPHHWGSRCRATAGSCRRRRSAASRRRTGRSPW